MDCRALKAPQCLVLRNTSSILRRILGDEPPVGVILADASEPMLRYAYEFLKENLANALRTTSVVAVGVDIRSGLRALRLDRRTSHFVSMKECDAFFLLGCTFANYPEDATLAQLKETLAPGDIVVVGIECFRIEDRTDKSPTDFYRPYESPSLRSYWGHYCNEEHGVGPDYSNLIRLFYE
jgi:hypothetical protein